MKELGADRRWNDGSCVFENSQKAAAKQLSDYFLAFVTVIEGDKKKKDSVMLQGTGIYFLAIY